MNKYRTFVAWREHDDMVDDIRDELLNRMDFLFPERGSDMGDELRTALSIAHTLRKYPHTTIMEGEEGSMLVQRIILALVLHVVALAEEVAQLDAAYDAWVTAQEAKANA